MTSKGFGASSKLLNAKIILNGGQNVTFVRADGYFTLYPIKHFSFCWFFLFPLTKKFLYMLLH